MHLVLLTSGKGDSLSTQHLHHGQHAPSRTDAGSIDLLVLDARHMSPACLAAATRCVVEIRSRHGLRHGVLLCAQPTLPLIVASIRCGLRDVITKAIPIETHLEDAGQLEVLPENDIIFKLLHERGQ